MPVPYTVDVLINGHNYANLQFSFSPRVSNSAELCIPNMQKKDVKNKIDLIEGHRSCKLRDGNWHVSGSVTPLIMGTFIFT